MFERWTRRSADRMEERRTKLAAISNQLVAEIETGLGQWQDEALSVRLDMLTHAYEEGIVTLEPADGLELSQVFAIEAQALLDNFFKGSQGYIREAVAFLETDTVVAIGVLGEATGAAVAQRILRIVEAAGAALGRTLDEIAGQELGRRSPVPITG